MRSDAEGGKAGVNLWDGNRRLRGALLINEDEPALTFYDARGGNRVLLRTLPNGSLPEFGLWNADGIGGFHLRLTSEEDAELQMRDHKGHNRLELRVKGDDTAIITISDEKENPIWKVPGFANRSIRR